MSELHVGPQQWVAALADGDDLVYFGCAGVGVRERLVDPLAAERAVRVVSEDSLAELGSAVAVGSAWVRCRHGVCLTMRCCPLHASPIDRSRHIG